MHSSASSESSDLLEESSNPFRLDLRLLCAALNRQVKVIGACDICLAVTKYGVQYAAGGEIISVEAILNKKVIKPSESTPLNYHLNTSDYPPGVYRFYLDDKRFDGSVIRSLALILRFAESLVYCSYSFEESEA